MPELLHVHSENFMAFLCAYVGMFSSLVFWMLRSTPRDLYLFIHIHSVSVSRFEAVSTTDAINNGGGHGN